MATTYINNNVKFHAFSKSPVSPDTTLGGAVNPSGHTITTSQVRAQDIPAFLNTFAGSRADAITWLGKNYTTPAHNDIAYYGGEFKAGFDTPKCLKYNGKTSTWEDFDLKYADRANNVLRTTLQNADDKDVLAIHQDCTTVFVDGGNNAATNSNRWSLFVKKADGSILDHFVASTDKIVAGMPSLGYNALVMLNNAAIDEGELDANYVGNTFAGIIHLNKQYANGDDAKFKVTCFEYIGEKLNTTISELAKVVFGEGNNPGDEDVSLTQKVAQNTAAIAKLNGTATESGSVAKAVADSLASAKQFTTDEIAKISTGVQSVTKAGDSELLAVGGTATEVTISLSDTIATKTYAENEASKAAAAAEQAAKNEAATNLATARGEITQEINTAKQAAIDNAKVTLTQGSGITVTPNAQAATAFEIAIDSATVALKSDVETVAGNLTTTASTIRGEIADEVSTLNAAIATAKSEAIADAKTETTTQVGALRTELTTGEGSLGGKVTALEGEVSTIKTTTIPAAQAAAEAAAKTETATQVAALKKTLEEGVIKTAQDAADAAQGTADQALTKAGEAATAVTTLSGTAVASQSVTGAGVSVTLAGTVGAPTLTGSVTTASYTPASDDVTGSWSDTTKVTIASDVAAALADVASAHDKDIETITQTLNSITTTGLTRQVLEEGQTLDDITEPKENVIYLVKDSTSETGAYVEYLHVGTTWEAIGTTSTDLDEYAKTETVNASIVTVTGLANAAQSAADTAQSTIDTFIEETYAADKESLEDSISGVSQVVASNHAQFTDFVGTTYAADKVSLEESIAAISNKVGTTDVTTQITSAIDGLNVTGTAQNGITVSQTKGLVSLSVVPGAVQAGDTSVVTGDSVATAIETAVATKIASVTVLTDSASHFGAEHITASTDASKNVTITVTRSSEWSVGTSKPATDITSVINGKMSNGTTIDDANLINGESMFASNTSLTTYVGSLSKLTSGKNMFSGCSALTTFVADLSSLENGEGMFAGCNLTEESVMYIVESLPTTSGKTITIGTSDAIKEAYRTEADNKGWNIA